LKKDDCPERNAMDKIEATGFVFKPICLRGRLISLKKKIISPKELMMFYGNSCLV